MFERERERGEKRERETDTQMERVKRVRDRQTVRLIETV